MSPCEPWLVDSVRFLVVSVTPLVPTILLPSLLRITQALPNAWLWVSTSVSTSCQANAF